MHEALHGGWLLTFLSTLSLRRATNARRSINTEFNNFYPRSPCGERRVAQGAIAGDKVFLSTLSLRRATRFQAADISTRRISIHALLAESDSQQSGRTTSTTYFYPRSPCGERLSKRATPARHPYFYPRSPCGERLTEMRVALDDIKISIHALLAESDCQDTGKWPLPSRFLSTLSLRRATPLTSRAKAISTISIHALLAESDGIGLVFMWWGVRFLSTLSLRRAT